ncbi:hypothetical protein [Paenibacillus glacialis]|uniref:Uncharacterized protein n=1 Tax=Paenibacillus glacialis TaxID=494026 RepID=A0A168NTM3_9BACL|nr:hypothetical protein [Paenibacillus glacialis]OAB46100.1 hypothetical protein PGLA_01525 [Paenibacillus glacialis]
MKTVSAQQASLQIDDYLDLLNFAKKIEDLKWQKEIIRKLKRMNDSASSPKTYDYESNPIQHL